MRINFKVYLLFEKITGKSFTEITDKDMTLFLYCIYCINDHMVTQDEFIKIFNNKKISEAYTKEIEKYFSIKALFVKEESKSENKESEKLYIRDIIPILTLQCGLDINYVMNEMDVDDIDSFIKNYTKTTQEKLLNDRLWTFFNILPHVGKGIKKPEDLIKFDFEKEHVEKPEEVIKDMKSEDLDEIFNKRKRINDGE